MSYDIGAPFLAYVMQALPLPTFSMISTNHGQLIDTKILYTRWEICQYLRRCKIAQPFKFSGSVVYV